VGVDAARGLALIGLMAVHVLPGRGDVTQEPTGSSLFLSGNSAALLTLLAGVGLALSCGGRFPHTGRWLAADRVGVAVRAVLIAVVGLGIGTVMPQDGPVDSLLFSYGVLLLLAIPFLHLSAAALLACAAVFWLVGPLLVQALAEVLPVHVSSRTVADVVGEPGGTICQLLLTGAYPVLPYLVYLLVGLGVGRVHLREQAVQIRLLVVGAGLVVFAGAAPSVVDSAFGGYGRLPQTGGMSQDELGEALVRGPGSLPTDTSLAIAAGLGVGLLVLGACLLIGRKSGAWLSPLSAMGAMALTLYTAHLVAVSLGVGHDLPYTWVVLHLGAAAWCALAWQRALGQGPLERVVSTSVGTARRTVLHRPHRNHWLYQQ
jgi:uncharacterized membrane protein